MLQSHLQIHLKLCSASRKLTMSVKGTVKEQKFEELIRFEMDPPSPIGHYHDIVSDARPPMHWIQKQRDWKERQCKRGNSKRTKRESNESKISDTIRVEDGEQVRKNGFVTLDGHKVVAKPVIDRNPDLKPKTDDLNILANEEDIFEPIVRRKRVAVHELNQLMRSEH